MFRHNLLWKLKLYKGYINVLLYEIMHHSNMIMITCVMKAKENTRIILLYEKVQLNVYKRLFDNEYLLTGSEYVHKFYNTTTKRLLSNPRQTVP